MGIFSELKTIRKVYKRTKKMETGDDMQLYNMQLNWIGEPYVILNVPNEFWETEDTLNSYVWKKISEFNVLLFKYDIDNLLYPVIYTDKKEQAVLIELVTRKTALKTTFKINKILIPILIIIFLILRYV